MFGRDAGAGVRHSDGDEVAASRGLAAEWRDDGNFPDVDGQSPFAVHGIARIDGKIDQSGLELRDVGDGKTIGVGDLDLDFDPAPDQRTNQLCDGFDLGADVEDLRRQRLAAGKRQQLRRQLRGPFDRLRDCVDIAPAALFRQLAAAEEVGGGADDGQEIVEIVRYATGQLADRFHLLRLPQHFLGLAALGDVDGFRHRADDRAVPIPHRTHREVEIALADRQMQLHLGPDLFTLHHGGEGIADGLAHAVGSGKPGRLPERLADDVDGVSADAVERRPVGVKQVALGREQPLILVAGLEDRAHLGFVGFQLRGALRDSLFEDFVQPAQIAFRLPGGGDVVGDADEADMLAGGVPARLRFRSQPAPFAVGIPVAGLQHEWLERGFAGDRFLQDALQIIGMQRLAPVEHDRFFERQSEKIQISLVGERSRAVELGDPDRDRRAVGDQAEAFLAFAQFLLRQHALGDVDMGADQAQRAAAGVAFEFRNDVDPPRLTVARPHDPVGRDIVFVTAGEGVEELLDGAVAVLGVNPVDPVLMGLVGRIGRQPVDDEIFWRTTVLETVVEVDLDAADAADALDPREFRFAFL